VSNSLSASSTANINRLGTSSNFAIHYFADPSAPGGYGDSKSFTNSASASGIGDLTFRLKSRFAQSGSASFGLGVDVRAPTGDEQNLLGSGCWGVRPFLVFSSSHKRASFHLNFSYQWNGSSVLAGDVETGTKAQFPDLLLYSGGATIALSRQITLALDVLAQTFINAPHLEQITFTALDPAQTKFQTVEFSTTNFTEVNGSAGLRMNLAGGLLLNANVLFKLNDAGLRANVTPLIGIEYSF
jgi:hypothetical protein